MIVERYITSLDRSIPPAALPVGEVSVERSRTVARFRHGQWTGGEKDVRHKIAALAAAFAIIAGGSVCAQSYPNRPIRFVVSVPAGGTQDASGRPVANQLTSEIGPTIVIDALYAEIHKSSRNDGWGIA